MFYAFARFCRRHPGPVMVFTVAYGPTWYGASVLLVERITRGVPFAGTLLGPHMAIVTAGWFHTLTILCGLTGVAYIWLLCWMRSLR